MSNYFCARLLAIGLLMSLAKPAQAKITIAYISDSPSSSVPQWIAKETGIFKRYGLDIDLVLIDATIKKSK